MSIYFQYPAIEEYPDLLYTIVAVTKNQDLLKFEDSIIADNDPGLKDFLTLKPV